MIIARIAFASASKAKDCAETITAYGACKVVRHGKGRKEVAFEIESTEAAKLAFRAYPHRTLAAFKTPTEADELREIKGKMITVAPPRKVTAVDVLQRVLTSLEKAKAHAENDRSITLPLKAEINNAIRGTKEAISKIEEAQ